jgi:hypothetical protein
MKYAIDRLIDKEAYIAVTYDTAASFIDVLHKAYPDLRQVNDVPVTLYDYTGYWDYAIFEVTPDNKLKHYDAFEDELEDFADKELIMWE